MIKRLVILLGIAAFICLPLLVFGVNLDRRPQANVKLFLSFDRGDFTDSSLWGNDASSTWNYPTITATAGQGAFADDQYHRLAVADFAYGNSQLTVAGWVRLDAASPSALGAVASHYQNTGNQRSWLIYSAGTAKARVIVISDGTYSASTAKDYTTSIDVFVQTEWHHVAFTFDAGTLKIYVDGVEDTSPTKTTDASITTYHDSTEKVRIQTHKSGGSFNYWDGAVDDVLVCEGVMTASEIYGLYKAGKERAGR